MAVIGGNSPTVTVQVPVPQPAPMKKPRPQPQPAAPQPVPQNPESQQQDIPQGMVPPVPQQPEPRAIILPWAPPPATPRSAMRKMRVRSQLSRPKKYAASDDDLSMDFDSMGEDQLPKVPPQRPLPKEDITGRTRKQILQQMLEAAKKGHFDPAGMTPRDYIQDMESEDDVPQGGGQVWLSDPEDEMPEEPKKMARSTPESLNGLFEHVHKNPTDEVGKQALAEELEEGSRPHEASILRSGQPHAIVKDKGFYRVRPMEFDLPHIYTHENGFNNVASYLPFDAHEYLQYLNYDEPEDRRIARDFRPQDFNTRGFSTKPALGHVRAVRVDQSGIGLHDFEDVPHAEVPRHMADAINSIMDDDWYGDWWDQPHEDYTEEDYNRALENLRNLSPYR